MQEIPSTKFIHCKFSISLLPTPPMKGTHPTPFSSNFSMYLKKTLQRKGSQPKTGPTWTSVLNSRNHTSTCSRLSMPSPILVISSPWSDSHHTTGYAQPPAHKFININPYSTTRYRYIFKVFSQAIGAHPIMFLYSTKPKPITWRVHLHSGHRTFTSQLLDEGANMKYSSYESTWVEELWQKYQPSLSSGNKSLHICGMYYFNFKAFIKKLMPV